MNTATEVLIPIQCEYALRVGQLLNNITMIREHLNRTACLRRAVDDTTPGRNCRSRSPGSPDHWQCCSREPDATERQGLGSRLRQDRSSYDPVLGVPLRTSMLQELAERGDYLPLEDRPHRRRA